MLTGKEATDPRQKSLESILANQDKQEDQGGRGRKLSLKKGKIQSKKSLTNKFIDFDTVH
jgi:hypothetical protein